MLDATRRPAEEPGHAVDHRDLLEVVESALADLPPAYAQAFFLRIHEDHSYREMSAICGEPEGTLRSRVHHAMKRVQRIVGESGFTPATSLSEQGETAMSEHHIVEDVLVAYVLDELDPAGRRDVEAHAATCATCGETIRTMEEAIARYRESALPDPPARVLMQLIEAQARGSPTVPEPGPGGAPRFPPPPPSSSRPRSS